MIFFHMRILKYTSLTISNVFHLPTTNLIYQEKGFLIVTMFFFGSWRRMDFTPTKKISNCLFSHKNELSRKK